MSNKKRNWYWGINNNTNTHCYLLEMVMDSLSIDELLHYQKYMKNNITDLCLEVGNMSDFFEQLNYVILADCSKSRKIRDIMNMRDHNGDEFIDKSTAKLIYNTMSMNLPKFKGGAKDSDKFDIEQYKNNCEFDDLDYLCNFSDDNQDEINKEFNERKIYYNSVGKPECGKMLDKFYNLDEVDLEGQCKIIEKMNEVEKGDNSFVNYTDDKTKREDNILDKFRKRIGQMDEMTSEGLDPLNPMIPTNLLNPGNNYNPVGFMNKSNKFNPGNLRDQLANFEKNPMFKNIDGGLRNLGKKLRDQLSNFKRISMEKSRDGKRDYLDQLGSENNKVKKCLPNLPQLFFPALFSEFNIPLNINDVLLIGFSVFPYIGWIFDIFMIFRALLERRWLYAILMTLNWYQWFFWKVLTFGFANVDLGPLFKIFYMGPYASKYFNISNLAETLVHFFNQLTGNVPQILSISN